ncbi:MAG: 50S ribosomal protein L9, partial [Stomatobaculum longum]
MKIVLLQDVKSLGKAGTLVEVSEGYARNFLLPKKLGAAATAENLNTLKLKQANEAKIAAEQLAEAKALAAKIEA